ncbi:hypothetical protein UFOVP1516_45 [uncultured Caudovirales phage]|uniref:Uncharacterized protein n=1 Tax=uncultured Caudovirales phage TaxID=2100421 RepID=A0A6J7XGA0_9CAUD|nr:hypothetical protein UFOVP887_90 [uncultured Caudovirales phage]CAB5226864.1 hypothetical protein UFOVP1516_45 [uncultured Caudovirales phage]
MSCYLVSNKEIYLLAASAVAKNQCYVALEPLHGVLIRENVRELMKQNLASVNYRYKEQQQWEPNFEMWLKEDGNYDEWKLIDYCLNLLRNYSTIQKIKAAHHYSYQACDSLDWKDSHAKKLVDSVIDKMIHELDGYDEAEWGI